MRAQPHAPPNSKSHTSPESNIVRTHYTIDIRAMPAICVARFIAVVTLLFLRLGLGTRV